MNIYKELLGCPGGSTLKKYSLLMSIDVGHSEDYYHNLLDRSHLTLSDKNKIHKTVLSYSNHLGRIVKRESTRLETKTKYIRRICFFYMFCLYSSFMMIFGGLTALLFFSNVIKTMDHPMRAVLIVTYVLFITSIIGFKNKFIRCFKNSAEKEYMARYECLKHLKSIVCEWERIAKVVKNEIEVANA